MSAQQKSPDLTADPRASRDQDNALATAGLLRAAKLVMFAGWLAPIVPVLGMVLLGLASTLVMVLTIIVMAKGNVRGGVTWLVISVVGGLLALLVWSGIYLTVASSMGR